MIKGRNQHVMPNDGGWCVIDESNCKILHHFDSRDDAMAYARACADACEGDVLLHMSQCAPEGLVTVPLPQENLMPTMGHSHSSGRNMSQPALSSKGQRSDYDPMLGFDEYYFEI